MKKNNILSVVSVLILVMAFTLFSCKKEDDDPIDTTTAKQCALTSYRLEFFNSFLEPWMEAFIRNTDGKIIKSERVSLPDSFLSSSQTITYKSNGNVDKIITKDYIDSFVYSGNEISKKFLITRWNHSIYIEYNFEYSNGKLKKVIWRDGKTRVNKGGYLLEWTNDNVTKVTTTSDSIGTVARFTTYSDYDNNNNPMRDYVIGFYSSLRDDLDVYTYLSKNNYGKITYSTSTTAWDVRKTIVNSDKYPTVIKHYLYKKSKLSDSTYYNYSYDCK